jgi:hypothetical protein
MATETGCCATADLSAVSSPDATSRNDEMVTAACADLVESHVPVVPEPDVYG